MVKKFFDHGRGFIKKWQNDDAGSRPLHGITPLSKMSNCGRTRVCSVTGDRKHCARMASLGVYPGNEIELICPADGDRCVIKVHGGTISIDRDTTENILVSE